MASSNRHWPSMFKSKPCNTTHHQWQQNDINSSLLSSGFHRSPYTAVPGCEERTPEPKPRWNPRPEQIRILEAIFNSGMVNPPRDEIRKIRSQLLEYGQVGDANVFYWFQNRKSRSKHKQRQIQSIIKSQPQTTTNPSISTSSSSSSDKSSPNNSAEKTLSVGPTTLIDLLNSPTASVNQPFFQTPRDLLSEPTFFPVQQNTGGSNSSALTPGFLLPHDQTIGNGSSCLLSDIMFMSDGSFKKAEDEKIKLAYSTAQTIFNSSFYFPSSVDQILQGSAKSTVFINDVCFEVGVGPFNVRETFGDDAVLIQSSSGHPLLTDELGFTLNPLRHGEFYYLIRSFTPQGTIHLI